MTSLLAAPRVLCCITQRALRDALKLAHECAEALARGDGVRRTRAKSGTKFAVARQEGVALVRDDTRVVARSLAVSRP